MLPHEPVPPRIFISYRREDSGGDAGRLADHLHRRYGRDRVFLDIDSIHPGTDFARVLHDSLQQTAAVLVVIGPRWTSMRNADGTPRFDSASDFVRVEVEAALGRSIPVIPVLVQGAKMPRADELPPSMKGLVTRQAVSIDHAEFHDDAERLCDRLSDIIGLEAPSGQATSGRTLPGQAPSGQALSGQTRSGQTRSGQTTRWPAAAVAVIALGVAAYIVMRGTSGGPADSGPDPAALERTRSVEALVATADAQRRRNQFAEALASLTQARNLDPSSVPVRDAQESTAMEWIREVRVEGDTAKFGDLIAPALGVIDAALPRTTGARRADLLAHTGWATFLLWRDGDRRLDPAAPYREALSIDPGNPFANAMLAHWTLYLDRDAVPAAVKLFATAAQAGRAIEAVRSLQWAAYTNSNSPAAEVERVRLADSMRKAGARLDVGQAQSMWGPYYFALSSDRNTYRETLLDAVPPDDYISTLNWAFDVYTAGDEARQRTTRLYVALLKAKGGRAEEAIGELKALDQELRDSSGALRDAVQAGIARLASPR